jgi:hypothetical protein
MFIGSVSDQNFCSGFREKMSASVIYTTMPPYGEPDWATPGDTSKSNVSAGLPPPAMPSMGGGVTTGSLTNGSTAAVQYVKATE